jgi:hypothetical protein
MLIVGLGKMKRFPLRLKSNPSSSLEHLIHITYASHVLMHGSHHDQEVIVVDNEHDEHHQ